MAKKTRNNKLSDFAIKHGRVGKWSIDQTEAVLANAETDKEVKKHLAGEIIEYFCNQLRHIWGLNGEEEFLAQIELYGRPTA